LVLDDIEHEVRGAIEDEDSVRGRIELGEGSVIESGATVRGPVSISNNTRIADGTYIGPYTSIGEDCTVDGVHLESSVVIGEATITCDQTIVDSLIGRRANITTAEQKKPDGDRLVVGENAALEL
jgi:glucose-1-phosphate thymidylyltransferase